MNGWNCFHKSLQVELRLHLLAELLCDAAHGKDSRRHHRGVQRLRTSQRVIGIGSRSSEWSSCGPHQCLEPLRHSLSLNFEATFGNAVEMVITVPFPIAKEYWLQIRKVCGNTCLIVFNVCQVQTLRGGLYAVVKATLLGRSRSSSACLLNPFNILKWIEDLKRFCALQRLAGSRHVLPLWGPCSMATAPRVYASRGKHIEERRQSQGPTEHLDGFSIVHGRMQSSWKKKTLEDIRL